MAPSKVFPVGSPWWVQLAWWAAAAVELLSTTGTMWLEPRPAARHLLRGPSTLRSWTLLRPRLPTAHSTTPRSSTPPTVHPPPDHTDPTTQSAALPRPPPPAAQTCVTATTPPTTRRPGWHRQRAAGRPRATAATANTTSTTWIWTQTLTLTPHPPPPAPSTCLLRRAAPRPPPPSAPTSTCAPLRPRPAPTPHDPPTSPGALWGRKRRKPQELVWSGRELMCQPPAVSGSHLLLRLQCLVKLPHWSFHHSSYPEALRVTIIWSAVSFTSVSHVPCTFSHGRLTVWGPRCLAAGHRKEMMMTTAKKYKISIPSVREGFLYWATLLKYQDFHQPKYELKSSLTVLLPPPEPTSYQQALLLCDGKAWLLRLKPRHGPPPHWPPPASHDLSLPSSQRPCWQTSGRTVYSVKIIWTKVNHRRIILLFYSRWLIHRSTEKKRTDRWEDVCMSEWWMDDWTAARMSGCESFAGCRKIW